MYFAGDTEQMTDDSDQSPVDTVSGSLIIRETPVLVEVIIIVLLACIRTCMCVMLESIVYTRTSISLVHIFAMFKFVTGTKAG